MAHGVCNTYASETFDYSFLYASPPQWLSWVVTLSITPEENSICATGVTLAGDETARHIITPTIINVADSQEVQYNWTSFKRNTSRTLKLPNWFTTSP